MRQREGGARPPSSLTTPSSSTRVADPELVGRFLLETFLAVVRRSVYVQQARHSMGKRVLHRPQPPSYGDDGR